MVTNERTTSPDLCYYEKANIDNGQEKIPIIPHTYFPLEEYHTVQPGHCNLTTKELGFR